MRGELADLVATFRARREGRGPWAEVDAGLLLEGPPGTGKTPVAAALARSRGVPLGAASCAKRQSAGHRGDLVLDAVSPLDSVRGAPEHIEEGRSETAVKCRLRLYVGGFTWLSEAQLDHLLAVDDEVVTASLRRRGRL